MFAGKKLSPSSPSLSLSLSLSIYIYIQLYTYILKNPHLPKEAHDFHQQLQDVIRITFVTSFFWYRAELALEVVDADVAWKAAKVAVVLQVGAWYM